MVNNATLNELSDRLSELFELIATIHINVENEALFIDSPIKGSLSIARRTAHELSIDLYKMVEDE